MIAKIWHPRLLSDVLAVVGRDRAAAFRRKIRASSRTNPGMSVVGWMLFS